MSKFSILIFFCLIDISRVLSLQFALQIRMTLRSICASHRTVLS